MSTGGYGNAFQSSRVKPIMTSTEFRAGGEKNSQPRIIAPTGKVVLHWRVQGLDENSLKSARKLAANHNCLPAPGAKLTSPLLWDNPPQTPHSSQWLLIPRREDHAALRWAWDLYSLLIYQGTLWECARKGRGSWGGSRAHSEAQRALAGAEPTRHLGIKHKAFLFFAHSTALFFFKICDPLDSPFPALFLIETLV